MKTVLYIHGKDGSPSESEHYKPLFPDCEVIGWDYQTFTPWETGAEIHKAIEELKTKYKNILLIANSIGAYFCMNAGIDQIIHKAYFISPVVDMEKLNGVELAGEWLHYVKSHPVKWNAPTHILYGSKDNLISFDDGLTVLESVDDAATICWGDDWRTPTIDQWSELLENTTFTWVEENGVKGRLVKGCNGNTIFLPAAGFREECDSVCTEVGVYWSSTLHNYIPERAWSYHFTFENCHLCGTYERTRGQCVRAVLSPK